MNSVTTYETVSRSLDDTLRIGKHIGSKLTGGEAIELAGDIGSGKTMLVHGIARGVDSSDAVTSPTFTISRLYSGGHVDICHFDFYRLDDPGLMASEFAESVADPGTTVVVEWSDVVDSVLPESKLHVVLTPTGESVRKLAFFAADLFHARLVEDLS